MAHLWDEIFGRFFNTSCMSYLYVVDHPGSWIGFRIDFPPGYGIIQFDGSKNENLHKVVKNKSSDAKFHADHEYVTKLGGICERKWRKRSF